MKVTAMELAKAMSITDEGYSFWHMLSNDSMKHAIRVAKQLLERYEITEKKNK